MKNKFVRTAATALSAILLIGTVPMEEASAAPVAAGVGGYTSEILSGSAMPMAGFSAAMSQCMLEVKEKSMFEVSQTNVEDYIVPVVKSEYADIAIAQVKNYLNVRDLPSEEGKILGKLYNNGAATVLGEEDGWYYITSGSVTGYVSSEYVVVGDEALAKSVSFRIATVTTDVLRVRKKPTTDSGILTRVPIDDELLVIDESKEDWVGVTLEEGKGYVSAEFVTVTTEYKYAESLEEERARLEKERREKEAAKKAAEAAAAAAAAKKKKEEAGKKTYKAPSGSDGQAVADYACQFVGNPYVYGGSSLTNGTDCSGFVMSVYAAFGIKLPHSSSALRKCGYAVDVSDLQPGDILCYSGHVAIYIGNGAIVHASNKQVGICISSPINYKKILAARRIF